MDTQMKELIAIGASVTANCVPCLRYHLKKVRETGVDEAQNPNRRQHWENGPKGGRE